MGYAVRVNPRVPLLVIAINTDDDVEDVVLLLTGDSLGWIPSNWIRAYGGFEGATNNEVKVT